jgi:hypothetical protein
MMSGHTADPASLVPGMSRVAVRWPRPDMLAVMR